jgi:dTDP-4-dehydrorhamnose 3,5-epimerase
MSQFNIKVYRLKISKNSKGDLLKYINNKKKYLKRFGETYFTEIKCGKTKGWNFHKRNQCLLAVPYGKVRFTFAKKIDERTKEFIIGKKNYLILVVPPKIWFKFTSLHKISIVVNTLNEIHSDFETLKIAAK